MTRGILVALAIAAACSSSSTPAKPDAAVDAFSSTCGHPGDMGNELGIGKFCTSLSDCSSTPEAHLCSTIGDATTHFCTKTCTATGSGSGSGSGSGQCGTDATCECNSSNQCGCTPNSCL